MIRYTANVPVTKARYELYKDEIGGTFEEFEGSEMEILVEIDGYNVLAFDRSNNYINLEIYHMREVLPNGGTVRLTSEIEKLIKKEIQEQIIEKERLWERLWERKYGA